MNQGVNEQFVKVIQAGTFSELETKINQQINRVSTLYNLKDCRVDKMDVGVFATLIFEVIAPSE